MAIRSMTGFGEGKATSTGLSLSVQISAVNKKQLDITDKTTLQDILDQVDPKIMVNAAAYTSVDNAENYKKRAYSVNHQGPKNLAEACRERSIFLIHISTDYVLDGLKDSEY